jgi:hypothetical protein
MKSAVVSKPRPPKTCYAVEVLAREGLNRWRTLEIVKTTIGIDPLQFAQRRVKSYRTTPALANRCFRVAHFIFPRGGGRMVYFFIP